MGGRGQAIRCVRVGDRVEWLGDLASAEVTRLTAALASAEARLARHEAVAEAAKIWRESEANNDGKDVDSPENAAYIAAWVALCDATDALEQG